MKKLIGIIIGLAVILILSSEIFSWEKVSVRVGNRYFYYNTQGYYHQSYYPCPTITYRSYRPYYRREVVTYEPSHNIYIDREDDGADYDDSYYEEDSNVRKVIYVY